VDDSYGWAVGGFGGKILHSNDGGTTWATQENGSAWQLNAVAFLDHDNGWSVGAQGTVLHTIDGGENWESQIGLPIRTFNAVHIFDASTAMIAGVEGLVLSTIDAGLNWDTLTTGITNTLYGLYFLDDQLGWAVGANGKIIVTEDGGTTWDEQTSGLSTFDALNAVHFVDEDNGAIAAADGQVLRTSDGGITWEIEQTLTNVQLYGLAMSDANTIWVAGQFGVILKSETTPTSVKSVATKTLPEKFGLSQNYPNPFNPSTIINYELPITNDIDLSIYNLLGQKVATLVLGKQEAGFHQIEWDASRFASGYYYYVLKASDYVDVKKMVLLR
jgi:photosystem II stability/assembly factor-like uncharacterized protein